MYTAFKENLRQKAEMFKLAFQTVQKNQQLNSIRTCDSLTFKSQASFINLCNSLDQIVNQNKTDLISQQIFNQVTNSLQNQLDNLKQTDDFCLFIHLQFLDIILQNHLIIYQNLEGDQDKKLMSSIITYFIYQKCQQKFNAQIIRLLNHWIVKHLQLNAFEKIQWLFVTKFREFQLKMQNIINYKETQINVFIEIIDLISIIQEYEFILIFNLQFPTKYYFPLFEYLQNEIKEKKDLSQKQCQFLFLFSNNEKNYRQFILTLKTNDLLLQYIFVFIFNQQLNKQQVYYKILVSLLQNNYLNEIELNSKITNEWVLKLYNIFQNECLYFNSYNQLIFIQIELVEKLAIKKLLQNLNQLFSILVNFCKLNYQSLNFSQKSQIINLIDLLGEQQSSCDLYQDSNQVQVIFSLLIKDLQPICKNQKAKSLYFSHSNIINILFKIVKYYNCQKYMSIINIINQEKLVLQQISNQESNLQQKILQILKFEENAHISKFNAE